MQILISNDDGVDALGLKVLAEVMQTFAEITVVAPSTNQSASSASLTLNTPLRYHQKESGFYSVTGTPCDCVHLGLHRIMSNKPDMVISGINKGANLGDDVIYSGTVAAAMEGRSLGYPAIAVSLASKECFHYETAAQVIIKIISNIKSIKIGSNTILNVNVPDLPEDKIKGFQLTRLGCRHRADTIIEDEDPRGESIYWIGPPSKPQDVGEGTDFHAISHGYVSITPLVVDLTAYQCFDDIKHWLNEF